MDYIKQFEQHLINRWTSPHTLRGYISDIKRFAEYMEQTRPEEFAPENITSMDLADYKSYLQTVKNRKAATINRALSSIRMFCQWAIDQDYLGANPAERVKNVKKVGQAPKWLERKEQLAMFRAVEKDANLKKPPKYILRDLTIVYVLVFCGLRVSELCELRLRDVTLSDRKGSILVRKGKGDKERTVPINVEARRVLTSYIEKREKEGAQKEDYLFIGQRGPITPHCVRHMLKKYDVNLKLNLHPHRLRHTFVRNLLDQQVPETDIIHMTGHKDFNALAPYGYPNQERLQSDVDRVRLT